MTKVLPTSNCLMSQCNRNNMKLNLITHFYFFQIKNLKWQMSPSGTFMICAIRCFVTPMLTWQHATHFTFFSLLFSSLKSIVSRKLNNPHTHIHINLLCRSFFQQSCIDSSNHFNFSRVFLFFLSLWYFCYICMSHISFSCYHIHII